MPERFLAEISTIVVFPPHLFGDERVFESSRLDPVHVGVGLVILLRCDNNG